MDELILILPIGDLTFVIVKIIGIIVEVSQWLAVIKNDTLAAIDIWRTVIANNIENDLDPCCMTGVDQTFQRGGLDKSSGLACLDKSWIETFKISRPITMHRCTAELKITDLLKQG